MLHHPIILYVTIYDNLVKDEVGENKILNSYNGFISCMCINIYEQLSAFEFHLC